MEKNRKKEGKSLKKAKKNLLKSRSVVDKIIIWAEKATFLQQPRNTSVRDRFLCIRAKAPGFFVYRSILPAKRVPLYIGKSKK